MEYLGVAIVLGLILIYYFINREYAKRIAVEYMLYIEMNGDELAVTHGYEKFKWVVDHFDSLPMSIKFVLTKEDYEHIVQKCFDRVIKRMELI